MRCRSSLQVIVAGMSWQERLCRHALQVIVAGKTWQACVAGKTWQACVGRDVLAGMRLRGCVAGPWAGGLAEGGPTPERGRSCPWTRCRKCWAWTVVGEASVMLAWVSSSDLPSFAYHLHPLSRKKKRSGLLCYLNKHPPCRHPPIRSCLLWSELSAHRHPGTSGPLHPCRICRACTRMPFSWTFLVRGRIGCRVTARGDEVQKREPQRARPGASGGFAHVFWHMCVAVCGAGKFTFCWRGRACCMYLRAGVLACWRAGVSFACPSSCGTHCGPWRLFLSAEGMV